MAAKKSKTYSFSCDPETYGQLVALAERSGRKVSNMLQYLINNYAAAQDRMDEHRARRSKERGGGIFPIEPGAD